MAYRQRFGSRGEALAGEWYEARGLRVRERNWRCREGELDLVVEGAGLLVVCEVKSRTSNRYGTGAEAVGARKQHTIRTVTARYLREADRYWPTVRFDVAVLECIDGRWSIRVVEAAF
ncbi:MAG: YraN family protein [Microthrixaceae bacterium]